MFTNFRQFTEKTVYQPVAADPLEKESLGHAAGLRKVGTPPQKKA